MDRKSVDEKYKWNLTELYASEGEWQKAKELIQKDASVVESFKGRLSENSDTFLKGISSYFALVKAYFRLSDYASRLADEDLNISKNQSLQQQSSALGAELSEKTAFISPEILKIDKAKIETFFREKPQLAEYKMFVDDILRQKAHTLSENEEQILASFGLSGDTPSNVYSIFTNAEMPFAKITLSTGEEVELTPASFTKYRSVENREDREKVFAAFFKNLGKFQNTLGMNLAGKVKTDYVYAKNRKYATTLESSLSGPNIPVSVYQNLIKQINTSLPTLHRFLALKKRMLGVDTLHYFDLYAPIVKETNMKFDLESGQKVILDALSPLGSDYNATLKKAFSSRWIDFLPTAGKRSGAYSSGASYDVHPYILMNWNGDYESVSTLAHELGHTMHSYYSNKTQAFANANYATFVAEIASTLNENLLNSYMVKHAKTNEEKLSLLGNYLELLRTTIFRQTLFAEFELAIHEMIEKGTPLTGESLNEIYYNLVKKYYDNGKGSCVVDPYIAHEWAYIPHFIDYTYYVYQYSTSLIYSTAIAEKINNEGQGAVDKYYSILKGGSSEYPIELVKKAGIDPLSAEPFNLAMARMNKVMDEIESILNKK